MARLRTAMLAASATITMAVAASTMVSASETINYTYDANGRLVKVEHSGNVNNNLVANYTLDRADNRKNIKVTGAP